MALLHALTNNKEKVGDFYENSFLDKFVKTHKQSSSEERARFVNEDKQLEEIH
jgi:hypothetical protein